ncbi:DUF1501 domain-containing protein [Ideonella sp. 4Y16]|uniref:DUF1501 domain-containing protein n=1 Tax=Ideonella alba TaxID=2824118 RepID=UPI001B35DD84|nr:DUF1501 domain-containing protein [Ideonella alba]MBQ0945767.1 DUF1501 domain-containing protein [Ideonella alba]
MQRRRFLHTAAALGLTAPLLRGWAAAPELPRFLLVFLRGGYDAASLLLPQDAGSRAFYAESRPRLAIAPPGSEEGARALDSDWALAPSVADTLLPLWQARQLGFVPFAGSEDNNRSHFETQDRFELGLPAGQSVGSEGRSGFLARLAIELGLATREQAGRELMSFTEQLPLVMQGAGPVGNVSLRNVGRPALDEKQMAQLQRLYAGHPLESAVQEGLATRGEVMREMAAEPMDPGRRAVAASAFATEARRIGRLMRERVALGFVDVAGWDTHANQGAATGVLATRLAELSTGLSALAAEMGPAWQRCTVLVASEFGRTWRENGTRGTDHGHGSVCWLLGGALRGGRIAGEQRRLSPQTLHQNRDWPVLNDYRPLLAGLWARQYGLSAERLARVFPQARPADLGWL